MAWDFDKTNSQRTVVSDAAALTLPAGDWTIGGWVRLPRGNAGTGFKYMLSWGGAFANPSVNWTIADASNADIPNKLRCLIRDSSGNGTPADATTFTSTSTPGTRTDWIHLLLIRSGSTTITQYIDATADGSISPATFGAVNVTGDLYFGARSDLGANRFHDGYLAEWFKIDRALASDERTALYRGMSPARLLGIDDSTSWYVPMRLGGTNGDYREYSNQLTVTNGATTTGSTHANHSPVTLWRPQSRATVPLIESASAESPIAAYAQANHLLYAGGPG